MAALISATLLRTQTDTRLVALAAQGSEPAFEALVERYRRPLQAYCRRMLLPAEAAEDVVQQAFLSTWTALRRGTEVQDARAWLYRVTHNAAINALKRSGYDHDQLDDALRGAGAPEEDLERRIAVRRTLAGLAALPEMQREALLRTAVEGQSHEAVARELGLTDGAVRGLVYRARSTLRTAATALTPAPVAQWAASEGASENAPLAERIAELVAGGGTAGASALLVKSGATLLTAGALVGGAVVVERERGEGREDGDRTEQRADEPASHATAAAESVADEGDGGGAAGLLASSGGLGDRGSGLLADRRDSRRGGSDDSGSGSRSSGSGSGTSGSNSGPAGGGDSGSSGSGSGSGDSSGSGSSGSGSGSGDDSSGSGSSGSGSGDSSGPGSGDDDDSSGSGSSGSGSVDDDNSGSGSTSSGSGDDGLDDNSGSGSTSSGSGDDGLDDSSGSGSSGSGSGGDDSSGSGSSGTGSTAPDETSGSGSGSSGSGSSGSGSEDRSGSSGSGDDELDD